MELEFSKLIDKLEKYGATGVKYYYEIGKWYKVEMKYKNKYHRFFALSFYELLEEVNDKKWMR